MKIFDHILKKETYTKEEVEHILLGTYEGFTDAFHNKFYIPKKRWLEFIDKSDPKAKTKKILVRNKSMNQSLGYIKWDSGWRQYVFDDNILKMAEGCQYEVFEKIRQLREEREQSRKSEDL